MADALAPDDVPDSKLPVGDRPRQVSVVTGRLSDVPAGGTRRANTKVGVAMALITITVLRRDADPELAGRRGRQLLRWAPALLAVFAGGVALAIGVGFAVANPTPQVSTTDVTVVPVSPAVKLLTSASIGANASVSKVVIGGTTKIPSNATTVQLSVTAGGAVAGVLNMYPAGDPAGASGQVLSWSAVAARRTRTCWRTWVRTTS